MTLDRRTRWLALIVLCFGRSEIVIDTTLVNGRCLDQGGSGLPRPLLAWVVKDYLPHLRRLSPSRGGSAMFGHAGCS